jgi:hypothetical protein
MGSEKVMSVRQLGGEPALWEACTLHGLEQAVRGAEDANAVCTISSSAGAD